MSLWHIAHFPLACMYVCMCVYVCASLSLYIYIPCSDALPPAKLCFLCTPPPVCHEHFFNHDALRCLSHRIIEVTLWNTQLVNHVHNSNDTAYNTGHERTTPDLRYPRLHDVYSRCAVKHGAKRGDVMCSVEYWRDLLRALSFIYIYI